MFLKLNKGDTIAVFSPSSPATVYAKKRYERAKEFLRSKGFQVKEGKLTGKSDGYRSGSIKERAEELNELLYDSEVKCIMSAIGGMNSNSLLPYIDYEYFRKYPKIVIGYSDMTAILLAIYAKTGIPTYYGPAMVASFGEFPPFVEETFEYFEDVLGKNLELPYLFKTPNQWTEEYIPWEEQARGKNGKANQLVTVNGGKFIGRLIGGNLNTMQGIWNTEYMPTIQQGDILLVEDSLKDAATIERSFALLKCSGVFDKIGGLILGKHEKFNDLETGKKPYEILKEVMGEVSFPVLAEFDCCHTHPMLTMPIGAMVELDADKKKVSLIK
ncbi:MAG: LD-carboxypeptidase [Peptostreptococcaceae bacterium]|nr:LD-carboxypeptidase [Peptostreptococcaceae bacterium]